METTWTKGCAEAREEKTLLFEVANRFIVLKSRKIFIVLIICQSLDTGVLTNISVKARGKLTNIRVD